MTGHEDRRMTIDEGFEQFVDGPRKSAFNPLHALVKSILENPSRHEWSVQGFGMMRTYLDAAKVWRLNMWDSALAVKNVSTLHDHPWHFTSWVVAGHFSNVRFTATEGGACSKLDRRWEHATIQTGPGGGLRVPHAPVWLHEHPPEFYASGCVYEQRAEEIHESRYEDGTVTINKRKRLEDGEHAKVFWPLGQKWVDAEPREATAAEIAFVCERSLRKWFTEDFNQLFILSPVRSAC
jgi:hypothetical protein